MVKSVVMEIEEVVMLAVTMVSSPRTNVKA